MLGQKGHQGMCFVGGFLTWRRGRGEERVGGRVGWEDGVGGGVGRGVGWEDGVGGEGGMKTWYGVGDGGKGGRKREVREGY